MSNYRNCLVVFGLVFFLVTLVSISEAKELKRSPAKQRSTLNGTEINSNATTSNTTVEDVVQSAVVDIVIADVEKEVTGDTTVAVKPPKPTYMNRVKTIIQRVLEALGLRKEKRKNRMLDINENKVQPKYKEEVRATVGALLGRHECLKQAACGAGSYLRSFKGKELILVFLEKVAPDNWEEAVTLVKEGAVEENDCNYKCLED